MRNRFVQFCFAAALLAAAFCQIGLSQEQIDPAQKNNFDEIQKRVKEFAVKVITEDAKDIPILKAVTEGDLDEIKTLILEKADVNTTSGNGFTALYYAAYFNHKDIVESLLAAGADIDTECGQYKTTSLFIAAGSGYIDIVKLLLDAGADKEIKGGVLGGTPLFMAAKDGHTSIVQLLLEAGADKDAKSQLGEATPLFIAAENGHAEVVKLLLSAGADKEAKLSEGGTTPLFIAANNGNTSIVQLLLDAGADENAKNDQGVSPLFTAVKSGHTDIVKILLDKGADTKVKGTVIEITPLHAAMVLSDQTEIVELLLKAGADIEARSNTGETPLCLAANFGHTATVKILLDAGADINVKNNKGVAPLHLASMNDRADVVKLLLDAGADINAKNKDGFAPLHIAAANGRANIVKLLLDAGADKSIRSTQFDLTPLELAKSFKHYEIVDLLSMPSKTLVEQNGFTLYLQAMEKENNEEFSSFAIKFAIDNKTAYDINVVIEDCSLNDCMIDGDMDINVRKGKNASDLLTFNEEDLQYLNIPNQRIENIEFIVIVRDKKSLQDIFSETVTLDSDTIKAYMN